jgi:hypothetical protein
MDQRELSCRAALAALLAAPPACDQAQAEKFKTRDVEIGVW